MLIKTIPVGQLEENCYVIINENTVHAVVIDPGDESNTIMDYIEDAKITVDAIFLTHAHYDHTGAVGALVQELGCPVYMHYEDLCIDNESMDPFYKRSHFDPPEGCVVNFVADNDIISLAGLTFKILHTPGHTTGGISIVCEDAIFTGDTLFKGSAGRTDFYGGDYDTELKSLARLCALPGDYEVYPGHMDSSTLERERNLNYYCREAMRRFK